jgi:hypothetical protein
MIYNTIHFITRSLGFAVLLITFLVPLSDRLSYAQPNHQEDQAGLRRRLMQRIDSIEVEKQIRKRNGTNFSELEELTTQLRDSLSALKNLLITGTQPPTKANSSAFHKKSGVIFKPRGLFDWVIVFVGSIAVVSGCILILGIITSSSRKQRRSPRKQMPDPGTAPSPARHQYQQLPQRSIASPEVTPDKSPEPEFPPHPQPKGTKSSRQVSPETEMSTDIDRRIVMAAREGQDIQQISRRFHISADQVALILKVAKIKQ